MRTGYENALKRRKSRHLLPDGGLWFPGDTYLALHASLLGILRIQLSEQAKCWHIFWKRKFLLVEELFEHCSNKVKHFSTSKMKIVLYYILRVETLSCWKRSLLEPLKVWMTRTFIDIFTCRRVPGRPGIKKRWAVREGVLRVSKGWKGLVQLPSVYVTGLVDIRENAAIR